MLSRGNSKEVVMAHIGQAGIQIGTSIWDLLMKEHKLDNNGEEEDTKTLGDTDGEKMNTFFSELGSSHFKPRSLFVDLDPTVTDTLQKSSMGKCFGSNAFISGKESGAANTSRGLYTVGKDLIGDAMDRIRKLAEDCDCLSGFIMTHSIASGTGGGFGRLLLERLRLQYRRQIRMTYSLFPSPNISTSVVEPYNCLLGIHGLVNESNISVIFDNESLYRFFDQKIQVCNPRYEHINRLIAQHFSSTTSCMRFRGSLNCDIGDILTNNVPYRRIKFLVPSYSSHQFHEKTEDGDSTPLDRMVNNVVLNNDNSSWLYSTSHSQRRIPRRTRRYYKKMLTKVRNNVYTINAMFRSREEITPCDIAKCMQKKITQYEKSENTKELIFSPLFPRKFKIGMCLKDPISIESNSSLGEEQKKKDLSGLINTSAIGNRLVDAAVDFRRLYDSPFRAEFIHWFVGEGMEEGEFSEAEETVRGEYSDGLVKFYEQLDDEETKNEEEEGEEDYDENEFYDI